MKLFKPFTKDQPLSYAEARPQFYRNAARESLWGNPVYFAPSTYNTGQTGTGGPYYKYGHNATEKLGKLGNCTWFALCRHHEVSGEVETAIIGDAGKSFDKYTGRKEGSLSKKISIGNFIKAGDCLVFADNLQNTGCGHIVHVESIEDDYIVVAESGYSTKECYRDKTCIVYTLKKSSLVTATKVTLRPSMPYTEYLYGVIHTGDCFDDWVKPEPVQRDEHRNQIYVENIKLNVRDEASLDSDVKGVLNKPNAYFNVLDKIQKTDYTWYHLGVDSWVAGVDGVTFYPADEEKSLKEKIKALEEDNYRLNNKIKELNETIAKDKNKLQTIKSSLENTLKLL